ncbi:opacity family porin [Neisseria animalis]|uniref:Porin opacity type domain-containing protein n=1 Tax=Neisseria animalis TaxID=492 RepID=A0A5P3MUS6_NEIAN|nr:opacity family porin [Neisseria animalis]QEY24409.1 hypothetical protein D0T90_07940 [Neisseria animalis]ROW31885.1 hypothetical protein CGZ60_07695 [Neisseria animalis]VEE06996.1 outer membrane protein [Neisseria animalis]
MITRIALISALTAPALLPAQPPEVQVRSTAQALEQEAVEVRPSADQLPNASLTLGNNNGVRYTADYTFFKNWADNDTAADGEAADLTIESVGVSAIYDFRNATAITPYAGARLGLNRLKLNSSKTARQEIFEERVSFGAGVIAGAQYHLKENLSIDAGIAYNYLGRIDTGNIRPNRYSATIGLNYRF